METLIADKTTPDEQARFRQTFRFTYTKGEGGMCTDVNTYRDLLTKELDTSEGYLPEVCNVQIPADRITGQLSVSDISETQTEVSLSLHLTWAMSYMHQHLHFLSSSSFWAGLEGGVGWSQYDHAVKRHKTVK